MTQGRLKKELAISRELSKKMLEPGLLKGAAVSTTHDLSGLRYDVLNHSPVTAAEYSAGNYRLSDLESHRRKLFQSEREHKAYEQSGHYDKNIDQEYVTFRREGYVTLGNNHPDGLLVANSSQIPASGMKTEDWSKHRYAKDEAQFETFNEAKSLVDGDDEVPRMNNPRSNFPDEPVHRSRTIDGQRDAKFASTSVDFNMKSSQIGKQSVSKSQANPFFADEPQHRPSDRTTGPNLQRLDGSQSKLGQAAQQIPKQGYLSRGMLMLRNRRTASKGPSGRSSQTPTKNNGPRRDAPGQPESLNIFDEIKRQAIHTVQSRLHFPN